MTVVVGRPVLPVPAIVELAGRQHGVILARQLMADLGVSYKVIRRLRRQQWLSPVIPGTSGAYAVGASSASRWQRAVAASLVAGPGAVLSHGTAAGIHQLPGLVAAEGPELTVEAPARPRVAGATLHRVACLHPADVTAWRGVPVTTPARTLVDLAGRLPGTLLERVLDEGILQHRWDVPALQAALERAARRPGRAALRHLLAARVDRPVADSHLELRVIAALAALQPFEVHYQLVLDGRLMVLDLAWPHVRVAGECDGWDARSRSRSKFDHDRRRENLLQAHGWSVAHLTSAMSDHEMVSAVLRLLLPRLGGGG